MSKITDSHATASNIFVVELDVVLLSIVLVLITLSPEILITAVVLAQAAGPCVSGAQGQDLKQVDTSNQVAYVPICCISLFTGSFAGNNRYTS